MKLRIGIDGGTKHEKRREDGSLVPLSDKRVAAGAYRFQGRLMVPHEVWERYSGGNRHVVRYCPIDWLPSRRAARVLRRLSHTGRGAA